MPFPATTAATNPTTIPSIAPATTSTTPRHQHGQNDTPGRLPAKQPVLTNDFHLDTFFNPVWTSGPHVFSFARDGTVVRPQTYALEPYPGYYADRIRRQPSTNAPHFQDFSSQHSKPLRNVAITEQGRDAEFAAAQATAQANAVRPGEWRQGQDGHPQCSMPDGEEPELVYTWPPKPWHG